MIINTKFLKSLIVLISFTTLLIFMDGCKKSEETNVNELKTAFEKTAELYNAGDIDTYFSLIHADVVYYTPGSNLPLEGKSAVRNAYDNLLSKVESAHWESIDPKFLVNGTTGIVWSPFKHTLKLKDNSTRIISGRDTEIFTKVNGEWLKIFEHMSYFPEKNDDPKQ